MNLYKIIAQHLTYRTQYISIAKYVITDNESDLYDLISHNFTYWDKMEAMEMYNKMPYEMVEHLDMLFESSKDEELTENDAKMIKEAWKKYVISTKGEYNAEWADYDNFTSNTIYYGWELVQENLLPNEIETLRKLKIVE